MRSKFNLPNDDQLSLVLEVDGCLVELDDIPSVISLQQPLMVLRGTETWTHVSSYNCVLFITLCWSILINLLANAK